MSNSATLIIYSIVILQCLIILTLLGLIVKRILGAYWEKYLQSRRNHLEPAVLNLLEEPIAIVPLAKKLRPFDRGLIKALLLQQAVELRGGERTAMTWVFEKLGYVAREVSQLSSSRWWRRRDAAINLGIMLSKQSIVPLLQAIRDEKREVGLAAIRALGHMRSPHSITPLLELMEQRTEWSTGKILEVLVDLGDLVKEPVFSKLSSTSDAKVRTLLVQLCGMMKWSEAVPIIVPLLGDVNHEVRISAARSIGSIGDATVAECLFPALSDDRWEVRAQAAKSLGCLQDSHASQPLRQCLSDKSWWVRYNAARALYQLGPTGETALLELQEGSDKTAADMAAQALAEGKLGID